MAACYPPTMAVPQALVEAAQAELRARRTPGTDSHARSCTVGWAAKGPPTELGRCIFQRWQEDLAARMDAKAEEYAKRGRDGTMTVVLIDAPPQVGKSEVVSRRAPTRFMAQLGLSVGIASYSASLAKTHGRKAREMLRGIEARTLWPFLWETAPKGLAETDTAEEWTIASPHDGRKGARMKVAGRGGGLTGYPFDVIVLDDMYKDMTDYSSLANRRQVSDFLSSQVVARLAERGGLVFDMGTRWGTQDTKGWWENKAKELKAAGSTVVIERWSYPLKAKADDVMGRPIGRYLTDNWNPQKEQAARIFYGKHARAILDCDPVDGDGDLYKREWLSNYYQGTPSQAARTCHTTVLTLDGASTAGGGDWSVIQKWGFRPGEALLLGQWRFRYDELGVSRELLRIQRQEQPGGVLVENASSGRTAISALSRAVPGLVPVNVSGHGPKLFRIKGTLLLWAAGSVLVPEPSDEASWFYEMDDNGMNLRDRLLALRDERPDMAGQVDDEADAATIALRWWMTTDGAQVTDDELAALLAM